MLTIIEDGSEIRRCQGKFELALKKLLGKKVEGFVGHMGATREATLNWSRKLGLWAVFDRADGSRFWNAFGLEEPKKGALRSILAEINFPFKGVDRRVAGVFVKGEDEKIFVCHSGRIGGGRLGIGKRLFKDNYRGQEVTVSDGKREEEFALIGDVNSPRFPYQVREFVLEVNRIKKIGTGEIEKIEPRKKSGFTPEFSGKRRFKLSREVVSNCDHGYVVGELARLLGAKNLTIGNDRSRDLYILDKERNILALFEVKTDVSTGSLYSGVGQLLINSLQEESKPRLILVIPKKLVSGMEEGLKSIGIECLTYKLGERDVNFKNLKELKLFEQGEEK
jgi:hypothetical protein